jgi:hypothetical protein
MSRFVMELGVTSRRPAPTTLFRRGSFCTSYWGIGAVHGSPSFCKAHGNEAVFRPESRPRQNISLFALGRRWSSGTPRAPI